MSEMTPGKYLGRASGKHLKPKKSNPKIQVPNSKASLAMESGVCELGFGGLRICFGVSSLVSYNRPAFMLVSASQPILPAGGVAPSPGEDRQAHLGGCTHETLSFRPLGNSRRGAARPFARCPGG